MFRLSSMTRRLALVLLAPGVLCVACDGTERDLGLSGGDGGSDAAIAIDAGGDDGPSADASTFSGQVTCNVAPCVTALSAKGGSHICALLADKTVRCWGGNSSGELGAETVPNGDAGLGDGGAVGAHSPKPVRVANVENATQISVSGSSRTSCGRIEDGSVMCWGSNTHAQLGLDTDRALPDTDPHPHASRVQGLPFASRVDLAGAFACAIGEPSENGSEGGSMHCWGENSVLQLGRGYSPTRNGVVGPVALRFRRALAGSGTMRVAFAIADSGELLSWGGSEWETTGSFGLPPQRDALGRETSFSPDGDPRAIPGLAHVSRIAAGEQHACAISRGNAYCWGQNATGAVGNSSRADVFAPYLVTVLGAGELADVAASNKTTCVTSREGRAYCWGDNADGQLGDGSADFTFNPARVEGLNARVVQMAPMDRATCALLEDGSVRCWGSNAEGQLGIGVRDDLPHYSPQSVVF